MRVVLTMLLGGVLLVSVPAQGQVYRWVDEDGVTHFGDRAPKAQRAEVLQLQGASQPKTRPTSSRHAYDPQKLQENERRYREAVAAHQRLREAQGSQDLP